MGVILEAKGICRQFIRNRGGSNIFYPVQKTDFLLQSGEFAVLCGASGSGKTTFLNMLSGILEPTEGQILLKEKDLYRMRDKERSAFRNETIGVIPQGQTPVSSLTVLENVLLPFTLYARKKEQYAEKKKLAGDLLARLQMTELENVMPSELSGGELRRAAVARALLMDPDVIMADEPTGDLDEENTTIVLDMLKAAAQSGKAVLVVTHDRDVLGYADTLYNMKDGILRKEE